MKIKWDKKYVYWGLTAFAVVMGVILIYLILTNMGAILDSIGFVINVLQPVMLGFAFAYILNPVMKKLELPVFKKWGEKLFKKHPHKAKSFARAIAITLTVLILIICLSLLLWAILPRVSESILLFAGNLSDYYEKAKDFLSGLFSEGSQLSETIMAAFESFNESLTNLFDADSLSQLGNMTSGLFTGIYSFAKGIINFFVGIVVAVYVLMNKEKFSAQTKKILYGHFKTSHVTTFLQRLKYMNKIFIGFIGGKLIDSVIVGVCCYILLLIFNVPYKELVSVIIGVTNIIPFFGPFIGAIPSALIILLIDPLKALTFVIIIILLQQFDGNVIGPRILGSATGLSGFWVIVALVVGGGFFGLIGMLVGVPVLAIIYAWIKSRTEARLEKKGITSSTLDFQEIAYIDPFGNEPVKFSDLSGDEDESVLKPFEESGDASYAKDNWDEL